MDDIVAGRLVHTGANVISGMVLPRFEYEAPPTVAEVIARLAEGKGEARVLAGGTDLLVRMKRGVTRPRILVSLRRVAHLSGGAPTDTGGLRVGALTTMSEIARSVSSRPRHPNAGAASGAPPGRNLQVPPYAAALAEGAASVGGPIIRNRATLGGNIVNARPCADTVPALIALDAQLHLVGCAGHRTVAVEGFITGPGETAIRADEILTAIELPSPGARRRGSCYLKATRRAAMEVTIVGCAARVDLEDDAQTVRTARLVFASVAPVPLRTVEAEQAIEGRIADARAIRDAAALARRAARPIDDCRAPADLRVELVEVLARRALQAAVQRAREGGVS